MIRRQFLPYKGLVLILCTALLFTPPWNLYETILDISEAKVSFGFDQYGHWTYSNHDFLTSFSLKKKPLMMSH